MVKTVESARRNLRLPFWKRLTPEVIQEVLVGLEEQHAAAVEAGDEQEAEAIWIQSRDLRDTALALQNGEISDGAWRSAVIPVAVGGALAFVVGADVF